ncbi:MAG: hypothetical protein H0X37_08320 [Herpetosiphonaceae bacterium]|nr:hypothetical protein [Herpetosiphonaceae bacterium]
MDFDDLLDLLEGLPARTYGYVGLAALFGPLLLRLLGLKTLGNLLRPAALVVLLGGLYAKQQEILKRFGQQGGQS